jgi:hypothetical protein
MFGTDILVSVWHVCTAEINPINVNIRAEGWIMLVNFYTGHIIYLCCLLFNEINTIIIGKHISYYWIYIVSELYRVIILL